MAQSYDYYRNLAKDIFEEQHRKHHQISLNIFYSANETSFGLQQFQRWKRDTEKLIREYIGEEDVVEFSKLRLSGLIHPKLIELYRDLSETEVNSYGDFVRALVEGIMNGSTELKGTLINERRYRVLHKIYDMANGNMTTVVLINDLENKTEIYGNEMNGILLYLEQKFLIKVQEQDVTITSSGIDEIEKTQRNPQRPSRYFPPNIINNYHNYIGGSVTGFQQGGQGNTQNIQINEHTDFDKAISKLVELIKSSSLSLLDKEEIVRDVERVQQLALKEKTPDVIERAQKKVELVKTSLETTELALKAAPYLATILQFFTNLNS